MTQILETTNHSEMACRRRSFPLLIVSLLSVCLLLNGCFAMMVKGNLEKVDGFPQQSGLSNKPSVYLELATDDEEFEKAVARATERSGLFRSFTFDLAEGEQVDYAISMQLSSRDEEMSGGRQFLTRMLTITACITPFGVPLPFQDVGYTLTASVVDRPGTALGSRTVFTVQESVTVWCGLALLPLAPVTMSSGERVWGNMVMVLYKKMLDNGLLVYPFKNTRADDGSR